MCVYGSGPDSGDLLLRHRGSVRPPLLPWRVDREALLPTASMAPDRQDICPRFPAASARVLDGGGACLALNKKRVAVFANRPLDVRSDAYLRLQGHGAEIGEQCSGQGLRGRS